MNAEGRRKAALGVEGGHLKVTRTELSMFVEARLQRFVGEELAPSVLALMTEDPASQAMLESMVQKAVAAHYGAEQAQKPATGILGLDGRELSSQQAAPSLILPE